MSCSDEIRSNLISTALRGHARDRPCCRAQSSGQTPEQSCRETNRTLFPTSFRSSADTANYHCQE